MKKDHSRLFFAVLITAIIVPLVNIVLIGSLRISFYSDITYPAWLSKALSYLSGIIDIACVFASYACLAYAFVTRKKRLLTSLIVGISAPVAYVASGVVDAVFFSKNIITPAYLLYSANSCLYELLRFGAALLVFLLIAAFAKKKKIPPELQLLSLKGSLSIASIWTAAVIAFSMLLSNAIETITLLLEFGAPINTTETITLISPYITTVIYAILGYFLAFCVMRLLSPSSKPRDSVEQTADSAA